MLVIQWQDVMLQQIIDGFGIQLVLVLFILISTFIGQCPSGILAVSFIPPTVQHGEIKHTVHQCLLARRTRSFCQPRRGIHPDIHTRDKMARQVHVVILQEYDFT